MAWAIQDFKVLNKATSRYLLSGNQDVTSLPTIPGNGDVDPAVLPSAYVVVEVISFCSLFCSGPVSETSFPLDWSAAQPITARPLPPDRHESRLGIRWFDRPLFLVAKWADDAPTSDIAAIAAIARSIRPEIPPPATGEYRGWDGLGPLDTIPVGTVRLEPLPAGAVIRPPYRTTDNVPFFLVRGKVNLYAFVSRPLLDQRCEIAYDAAADRFTCTLDGRRIEWTRFGRFLGPEPASDLPQHNVIVRGGQVWIHYIEAGRYFLSARVEAAER
jgi:hypothetical protein